MDPLNNTGDVKLCPSGRCHPGAKLLGIRGDDGSLGYVTPAIDLTSDFCEIAAEGRNPHVRFRFTEPCVENRCAQWQDGACGVIREVIPEDESSVSAMPELPRCGIRASCRWFAQEGRVACRVCPGVATESTSSN